MSTPSSTILQFQLFNSAVDMSFWHELAKRKLELYKLKEDPIDIGGYYTTGFHEGIPSRLCIGQESFAEPYVPPVWYGFSVPGVLHNKNTIESFKAIDTKSVLSSAGAQIWNDIESGAALANPVLLNRFVLLTFANLKTYNFLYWFGFPALCPDDHAQVQHVQPIDRAYTAAELQSLCTEYDKLRGVGGQYKSVPFFLVKKSGEGTVRVGTLSEWDQMFTVEEIVRIAHMSLSSATPLIMHYAYSHQPTLGFADPCPLAQHPGWPLRNVLLLLAKQKKVTHINVLCYREQPGKHTITSSVFLAVTLPSTWSTLTASPKVVGWEKHPKGKMTPRQVKLAAHMDPVKLASTAVDLNLKLMRWRLMPAVDLERVASLKCLLLGAGTLGCNVARALMAWGVRTITLIDNGTVSFSNPVRQTLFQFTDCLNGGKPKAEAAAESLRAIFPEINATGHRLSIPMPGHPVPSDSDAGAQARREYDRLVSLVQSHDAVFLLTDSRESRWLPTVLCKAMAKLCINAALGFDTYLVMRHGAEHRPSDGGVPLGCYFCNDVVAPQDSLSDRTLDQQCTVTRPSVSAIASAMAVELLVALLHHPQGVRAPADTLQDLSEPTASPLGLVPHQIRGFLTHFHNLLVVGHAYDKCTACSQKVIDEFRSRGWEFLLKVFNEPRYLEELTGLSELYTDTTSESVSLSAEGEDDF